MTRQYILRLVLVVSVVGGGGGVDAGEGASGSGAPAVIVWGGARWQFVTMVENRGGTIIYQKRDAARPVAARQNSVDVEATLAVNRALESFYLACHGHQVELSDIFGLSGRSRDVLDQAATQLSRGCYESLATQYRSWRDAGVEPTGEPRLSDVASELELHRGGGGDVGTANEKLQIDPESVGVSGGEDGLSSAEIARQCADAWPDDPSRQQTCVEEKQRAVEQQRGRSSLSSGVPPETFQRIRVLCQGTSPDDARVVNTCERSQVRAYKAIEARTTTSTETDARTFSEIRDTCQSKWPEDFSRRDRCESGEFAAHTFKKSGQ